MDRSKLMSGERLRAITRRGRSSPHLGAQGRAGPRRGPSHRVRPRARSARTARRRSWWRRALGRGPKNEKASTAAMAQKLGIKRGTRPSPGRACAAGHVCNSAFAEPGNSTTNRARRASRGARRDRDAPMSDWEEDIHPFRARRRRALSARCFDDLLRWVLLKEEIEEGVNHPARARLTPYDILTKGRLSGGMTIVGNDFATGILFVPEVLMAANAMKGAAMAILQAAAGWKPARRASARMVDRHGQGRHP